MAQGLGRVSRDPGSWFLTAFCPFPRRWESSGCSHVGRGPWGGLAGAGGCSAPTHGPGGAVLVWAAQLCSCTGEAGELEVGLECRGRLCGMGSAQPLSVVGSVLFNVNPIVTLRAEPRGRSSLTSRLVCFEVQGRRGLILQVHRAGYSCSLRSCPFPLQVI